MMENIGLGIAVATAVTALIKIVPIMALAHRPFPKLFRYWLNFVPAAVLSAIIVAEILEKPETTSFGISVALLSTIVSLIAGMLTRSLFVTVVVSIFAFFVFQNI